MRVSDVIQSKGSAVITVGPDVSILQAMRKLVEHNIGSLVVFDGELKGILTERDLLRAAAQDPQRLATECVVQLMSEQVITVGPDEPIAAVMDTMTERRIRHLPVVERGELRGIVSIGDVVNALRESVEEENRYLHAYIDGTPL